MKNKNGFLLAEETLKIVIALISITFLIYFLTALYFENQISEELEQAEASLKFLVSEINDGREEVTIYNPEGWWIISWPYEGIMPDTCSNPEWENCICIFPKGIFTNTVEGYKEDGDEGECKEISKAAIVSSLDDKQSPIKIENPPLKLNIEYGDEIKITKK